MLAEDTISRIPGSCHCDGRKLGDKNHCRKNRTAAEKIENFGSIFLALIFVTQPYPTPLPPSTIAIIAEPSNLRYWVFIKHFRKFTHHNRGNLEDAISQIRVSCDCDGERGGNWMMKISAKKLKTSVWFFWLRFSSLNFTHTPFPQLQSSQHPRIRDIESSSNIFGNLLITIAGLSKTQYANSRVPQLWWEWGWRRG